MASSPGELDGLDKELLNRIQGGFPVAARPYDELGAALGISGQEALARVRRMVASGVVRKVGPFFDARKMGYASTLCAADVPEERIEEVASIISSFPQVTHNYQRAGSPNLWFTVIDESRGAIDALVREISQRAGVGPIRDLPATRMFKVKVDLKVE